MIAQRNGHIVSTLTWDTTFDDKALGVDLQNRIGHWSNFVMPGELDYVFKQACPEGMSLSISSLEIDLGEIAVDNLEQQLKVRLGAALKEKLADILRYPATNQNVMLIEQGMATLESLRYFLINGVLPWNHHGDDLNPLVADLFRKQQIETVSLLREAGSASTKARKRIAWQFDEQNFNETIRGFEPVGHEQIDSLSCEIVRLQHKEQFVRSSVADLGKEIRLWILNYLLSDRGTFFNKVAFMKGLLEQMAQRHNMDYIKLLTLVEVAIEKPDRTVHVRGEFMTVISMLSKQYRSAEQYQVGRYAQLQDLSLPVTTRKDKKFYVDACQITDSIIEAGYENSQEILVMLPSGISYWLKHQKQLDDRFISVFLNACIKTWSPKVVQLATYFTQLPNGIIPYISRQIVRAISVSCLLTYQGKIDEGRFFDYFLEQAAHIVGKTNAAMAHKLCAALVAYAPFGMQPDNIYKLIATITQVDVEAQNTSTGTVIIQNLNKYYLQVLAKEHDRAGLVLLRRDLSTFVRGNPRAALQILRGFKNNATLFQTVPLLGDETLITKLLEADKGTVFKAMKTLENAIVRLYSVASRTEIALLRRNAYRLAFKALIIYPGISIQLFLKDLVKQMETSGRFNKLLLIALGQGLGIKLSLVPAGMPELKADIYACKNEAFALICQQVLDIKTPLPVILDSLYRYRNDDMLISIIRQDSELCSLIFNRLFNNGSREVRQMISAARNEVLISNSGLNKSSVEKTLDDLFWQCFISNAWYQQGFVGLKNSFKVAVAYRYPLPNTCIVAQFKQYCSVRVGTNISFKILTTVEQQELTVEIKKAIATGRKTITRISREIDLAEVLSQIISSAQNVDKIFTASALSDREIVRLMHIVDLGYLLQLLKNNRAISKQRVGDIALMNILCNESGSQSSADAALVGIFRQILLLSKSRANWQHSRDRLIKRIFPSMTSGKILSASVADKFNAGGFTASRGIRRLILSLSPGQQQLVEKLNGQKLKPTGLVPPLNYTGPALNSKRQIDVKTYDSPVVAKEVATYGYATFCWYRQNGNSSTSALQLRTATAKRGVVSIPHWYKQADNFISSTSGPRVGSMNVSGPVNPYWYGLNTGLIVKGRITIEEGMRDLNVADGFQQNLDTDMHVTMLLGDVINAQQKGITSQLLKQIISTAHIPSWFNPAPDYSVEMLVGEIVRLYPDTLPNMLRTASLSVIEVRQISGIFLFEKLLNILSDQNSAVKALANEIESLYIAIGRVSFGNVTGRQMQLLVYRKLLLACITSNYALFTASRIWNELAWDVSVNFNISKDKFIQGASVELQTLAPAYRLALGQLITLNKQKNISAGFRQYLPEYKKNPVAGKNEKLLATPIPVKNAGMVLLGEYVPTLFRLMELLNGKAFISPAKQLDAVHVLQYAVTGMMETSEIYLPLNKIMCGLRLDDAVADGISLTGAQQELVSGMIMNLVSQWMVIGKTSVDGFRGNWLVRDGMLSETEERWELVVQSRPYDILINKFPFSYSIIKYQWMDKPLHVKWKI
jgi:hypothetical protein